MTFVERFIEINSWSTSRKTVLLSAIALPGYLITLLVDNLLLSPTDMARMEWVNWSLAAGSIGVGLTLVFGLVAAHAKQEGRWTGYLFVVFYGLPTSALFYGMGTWSTPHVASWAIGVLLATLYYGKGIAWFAFLLGLFVMVTLTILESVGVLPYAPALIDRTIDAQRTASWAIATMTPFVITVIVGFLFSLLIVGARELQDARLREAQKLIRRYVPSQLAEKIIKGEHTLDFQPERAKLTIFFSDVVGFTEASDQLDAEDLAAALNEYLSEMSAIAERYGATINQFVGDGIMIFFGAPQVTSDKDHALRAVRMALEMQRRMLELQDIWHKRGIQKPFRARIGINTGHASVGDFGSAERKVYSAIGVQTNLAARIQAHCGPGKVLISHSTWGLVHEEFACTDKGELQFKGLHYAVRVYEVGGQS